MTTQKCNRCKVTLLVAKFKVKRCGNTQKYCIDCNAKLGAWNKKNKNKHACPQCKYKCSRASNLTKHIKAVHEKIKGFKCDKCKYECYEAVHLRRHIKAVHEKIKGFKCDKCKYTCSEGSTLHRHIKICTGELNISSGELMCRNILDDLKIEYETEVSKIQNADGNWLRFDFEIKVNERTMYIEIDGRHHFKPVRFGGISEEKALANLRKVQRDDKHKDEWCDYNGLPLLRIPTSMKDQMRELIEQFIL